METNRIKITFYNDGPSQHYGAFIFADGNGSPWLCGIGVNPNAEYKLGQGIVKIEKTNNYTYIITAAVWSMGWIFPYTDYLHIQKIEYI